MAMNHSDMDILLSTQELEELDTITTDDVTNAAKVILFNDEVHSFDEVIDQIIKAINCSFKKAEKLTWEVHTKGKACVFDGDLPECLRVSSVLEEIALHTQVEY
jgi:ATP-dependent Clp protease adapter protein ClpS